VIEATMHRFRPILLTASAAILGMVPIAPTVFWGPMAYAIMGGLAVATVLTLIFLPALYVAWFRISPPQAAAEVALAVRLPSRPDPAAEAARPHAGVGTPAGSA
jgi:multidrug efflux pump